MLEGIQRPLDCPPGGGWSTIVPDMENPLHRLGAKIRYQREKQGLKQQDLASALSISPQAVSNWERGDNAPDLILLPRLARALGVSSDWLLSVNESDDDVFEAVVLVLDIRGAYARSLEMDPRDYANWANGLFHQLTDLCLRFDAIPIKYMGDAFLCLFSGVNDAQRAVDAVLKARLVVSESVQAGLHRGELYLGSVGHPDHASSDIMGADVNVAFLTQAWAGDNTTSGLAMTRSVADRLERCPVIGEAHSVSFKGIKVPVDIMEIVGPSDSESNMKIV